MDLKQPQQTKAPKDKMTDLNEMTYAIASNSGGDTIPLMWGGGKRVSDKSLRNKKVYLSGKDVGYEDVLVETDFNNFTKTMKNMTKEQATGVFKGTWENLKNIDVDKIYQEKGEAWGNFCDDIMLFYCARFVLFKVPAPASLQRP
jgi:hypothetical protein